MPEIRLTPTGRLSLHAPGTDLAPASTALTEAFARDWREGLFLLAARGDLASSPSMSFWTRIAADYLTRLCHAPEAAAHVQSTGPRGLEHRLPPPPSIQLPPPPPERFQSWADSAPPMVGGEYLSSDLLAGIWDELSAWAQETMARDNGPSEFLRKRAPRWNQVGRVTFHLAENKTDEDRPFAFMASFSTGMDASGQVRHLPLRKALELYAGAGNKAALLKLLTPVHEAANRLDWVKVLVDEGDVYRPMAWSVPRAYEMLRSAPSLEDSGLSVRLPNWWRKRPRPQVGVVIGEQRKTSLGAEAMLDFRVQVALGDTPLTGEDMQELLSGTESLVLFKGQWVEVDRERLQEALEHWKRLEREARTSQEGQISFINGMRLLAGASADLRDDDQDEAIREWAHVQAGTALREILDTLRDPARLRVDESAIGLSATLRPYQKDGVGWLHLLTSLGLGACLADDMGLGKTIQVLGLLSRIKAEAAEAGGRAGPSLLLIPASLLGNWRAEARHFAPNLRLLFAHPSETPRKDLDALARDHTRILSGIDLVVTTYSMVGRMPWLAGQPWRLVILDEAQAIKNPSTAQSRAAKKLPAQARVALTGTPVENRLGELWSLFDFLNPGLLGNAKRFKDFVKALEARENDPFGPLRRLAGPYILRRLKTDRRIIADLPDKTETVRYCLLTKTQVKLYQQVVNHMTKTLKEVEAMARRGLVLQTLMRLKQIPWAIFSASNWTKQWILARLPSLPPKPPPRVRGEKQRRKQRQPGPRPRPKQRRAAKHPQKPLPRRRRRPPNLLSRQKPKQPSSLANLVLQSQPKTSPPKPGPRRKPPPSPNPSCPRARAYPGCAKSPALRSRISPPSWA
ncbi:DEAD/DEAH box helicase [Desulfonatronum lacustre]|uniref:DEAD/DEAH box helicase n=1 Tax=Desulfonatronum lacustre TaxID=66849 RepID=UPI0004B35A4F|nr:SNF2-related protein [Desulfonatronum lacustre]